MGSIRERKGARGTAYAALWRDPNGKQRSKSFPSPAGGEGAPEGAQPGPRLTGARTTARGHVAAYAATWIEEHQLKPVARETYRNVLDKHILPALGGTSSPT